MHIYRSFKSLEIGSFLYVKLSLGVINIGVNIGDNNSIVGNVSIPGSKIQIIHLCENCKKLDIECPKMERYNEVTLLLRKHMNLFYEEFYKRLKDTEYKEYTLEFQDAPNVTECPYFEE